MMCETNLNFLNFSLNLFDLEQSLNRLKTIYCKAAGLKPVHILWILVLDQIDEPITCATLCRLTHVDKALLSREMKNLINLGLIEKRSAGCSSYNAPIVLTDLGRSKARLINQISNDLTGKIHEKISSDELECYYRVSRMIKEEFDERSHELSLLDPVHLMQLVTVNETEDSL